MKKSQSLFHYKTFKEVVPVTITDSNFIGFYKYIIIVK